MRQRFIVVPCVAAVIALGVAASARADALYFQKTAVKTSSEKGCLGFAETVARNQAFTNYHSSSAEVAGMKDGAYIAITCVGRGQQPAIAVVMSMAPNFELAKKVGGFIAERMRAITRID
jgi:hypothetical protein